MINKAKIKGVSHDIHDKRLETLGTNGQVLSTNGTDLVWAEPTSGGADASVTNSNLIITQTTATPIEANPSASGTTDLTKLKVGETVYNVEGSVKDVKVNDTSVVNDGVANIPMASANSVGIVRPYKNYGMTISANGILGADTQTATEYNNTSVATFIGKGTLENIKYDTVKAALCDGVGAAWTDAEKLAAQQRLGILSSEGVGF